MSINTFKANSNLPHRVLSVFVSLIFICNFVMPLSMVQAQSAGTVLGLPEPGKMVEMTDAYAAPAVIGLAIHADDPLEFDFILDMGEETLDDANIRSVSEKLIKYFLAGLTVPPEDLWVNLSPYEQGKIIPNALGDTEMGRDLLAQDYVLKQISASIMHPEKEVGEQFWNKIYEKALEIYGTIDIPTNTFNKIWVIPDEAFVYESNGVAYVVNSHLKVMLEEDYLVMKENMDSDEFGAQDIEDADVERINKLSTDIYREVLLPVIEKEVNEGKLFANLRQIYNSMILASWYKEALRESILTRVYANKNLTSGINVSDVLVSNKIYEQYVSSFEKGAYNILKKEFDPKTKGIITRRYFSGGFYGGGIEREVGNKMARSSSTNLVSEFTTNQSDVKVTFRDSLAATNLSPRNKAKLFSAMTDLAKQQPGVFTNQKRLSNALQQRLPAINFTPEVMTAINDVAKTQLTKKISKDFTPQLERNIEVSSLPQPQKIEIRQTVSAIAKSVPFAVASSESVLADELIKRGVSPQTVNQARTQGVLARVVTDYKAVSNKINQANLASLPKQRQTQVINFMDKLEDKREDKRLMRVNTKLSESQRTGTDGAMLMAMAPAAYADDYSVNEIVGALEQSRQSPRTLETRLVQSGYTPQRAAVVVEAAQSFYNSNEQAIRTAKTPEDLIVLAVNDNRLDFRNIAPMIMNPSFVSSAQVLPDYSNKAAIMNAGYQQTMGNAMSLDDASIKQSLMDTGMPESTASKKVKDWNTFKTRQPVEVQNRLSSMTLPEVLTIAPTSATPVVLDVFSATSSTGSTSEIGSMSRQISRDAFAHTFTMSQQSIESGLMLATDSADTAQSTAQLFKDVISRPGAERAFVGADTMPKFISNMISEGVIKPNEGKQLKPMLEANFQSFSAAQADTQPMLTTGVSLERKAIDTIKANISSPTVIAKTITPVVGREKAIEISNKIAANESTVRAIASLPDLVTAIPETAPLLKSDATIALAIQSKDVHIADIAAYQTRQKGSADIFRQVDSKSYISSALRSGSSSLSSSQKEQVANFVGKQLKDNPELKQRIVNQGMDALTELAAQQPMVAQLFNADVTSRLNQAARGNRSSEQQVAIEQVGMGTLTQLSSATAADIRPMVSNISQRVDPKNAPSRTKEMMNDVSAFLSSPEVKTEMAALSQGRSSVSNVLDKAPSPRVKETMALIMNDPDMSSTLASRSGVLPQTVVRDVVSFSNKQAASIVNTGDVKIFQKALANANVPVRDITTLTNVMDRVVLSGTQISQMSDLMNVASTDTERMAIVSLMTDTKAISSLSSTASNLSSRIGLRDINAPSKINFYATQALKDLDEDTMTEVLQNVVETPRQARQIARTVVDMRQRGRITDNTLSLSDVVSNATSTASAKQLSTLGDKKVQVALYQAGQLQSNSTYTPQLFDAAQRTALQVAVNMDQNQVEQMVTQIAKTTLPNVSTTDIKRASQSLSRTFEGPEFKAALSRGKVSSLKDVAQYASDGDKINLAMFSQPVIVNAFVNKATSTGSSDYVSLGRMELGSFQQLQQMSGRDVRNFMIDKGVDATTARQMEKSFSPAIFKGVSNVGELTSKVANLPDMPEQQKRDIVQIAQTAVIGIENKSLPVSASQQSAIVSNTYQKAVTGISLNLDKPEIIQANLVASGLSPMQAINTVNTLSDFAQSQAGQAALSTAKSPMDFVMQAPQDFRKDLTPIADTKFTALMANEAPTLTAPQMASVRTSYKTAGKTLSSISSTNVSNFKGQLGRSGASKADIDMTADAVVAINRSMTAIELDTATPQTYIAKARTPQEAVAMVNVFNNSKAVVSLASQNMNISAGEATQISIANRQLTSNAFQGLVMDGAANIRSNAIGALKASGQSREIGRVSDALRKVEASPQAMAQFVQSGSISRLPEIAMANNLDVNINDFSPLMDPDIMSNLSSSFDRATSNQASLAREIIVNDTIQAMPKLKSNEVRDVVVKIFGESNAGQVMANYDNFKNTPGIGRKIRSGASMNEVLDFVAESSPSVVPQIAVMLNSPQFVELAAKTSGNISPGVARNTLVMENASATATFQASITERNMPIVSAALTENGYSRSNVNEFRSTMTNIMDREGGAVNISSPADILQYARTPQEVQSLMPMTNSKVISSLGRRAIVRKASIVQNIEFETASRISITSETELSRPITKVYGASAAQESINALSRVKANPAKMARLRSITNTAELMNLADTDQDAVALARFGNTAVMNEFLKPIMNDQIRLARQNKKAATGKKGGIDLNPVLPDMEIQRDGSGVPLPVNQQILDDILIDGFSPIINNIIPLGNATGILHISSQVKGDLSQKHN